MAKDVDEISEVVKRAFLHTHRGYSTDEVIIRDRLNVAFIQACKRELLFVDEETFNWRLISLRKQGKLGRVTRRRKHANHEDYLHAAEIAARHVYDKYSKTVDRAFCAPELRRTFDAIAHEVAPDVSNYLLRKAALKLRKNRQLKPELVPRVTSWGKRVLSFAADRIVNEPNLIPRAPGVYIFRDTSGYLYIGESKNLYLRIRQHLDHSDRKSLAHYFWEKGFRHMTVELHVFDANSGARQRRCRQAYESDLIQARLPRFNLSP
jgi:predicted GIY-YIG superfamily endonuclease